MLIAKIIWLFEELNQPYFIMTFVISCLFTVFPNKAVQQESESLALKHLAVKDAKGRAKIAVWREITSTSLKEGDLVTLTNVVKTTFKGDDMLQTAAHSTIDVAEVSLATHLSYFATRPGAHQSFLV